MLGRPHLFSSLALLLIGWASLQAQSARLTVLHVFQVWGDGSRPWGPMVQDENGDLYGTTRNGGSFGCGTFYRVSRDAGFRLLYTFTGGGDGCEPQGVVQTADGAIFGSTRYGATHGGTLFRVGRTGALTTLFVFRRAEDGSSPGPLAVGPDGHLYGRTAYDGLPNPGSPTLGTAFRLSPEGRLSVIHRFTDAEKTRWPATGALLLASDGQLYGTTTGCGNFGGCGDGSVFRLRPDGEVERLATFAEQDVSETLVEGSDGRLYGTASSGVYAVTASGAVTMFPLPWSVELKARGSDGRLYGQRDSFESQASLISMTTAGVIAPVNEAPPLGQHAVSALFTGRDGLLYGSTEISHGDGGLLFRLEPVPAAPRHLRFVRGGRR